MSLARLVVLEGPDAGREFELPMRGGGIGRGEGNLVPLTDPPVSRSHRLIQLRRAALEAHRAFVLAAGKRPAPVAAAMVPGETAQLQIPQDLIEKVIHGGVVTAESGGRALIAAPVHGSGDDIVAVLWIDRKGAAW